MPEHPSDGYTSEPVAWLAERMNPENPRVISQHMQAALARSLEHFGAVQSVVVNRRTLRVVSGHQRIQMAPEAGLESLPVRWVDLPEREERVLALALNRIGGQWNDQMLATELAALSMEHQTIAGWLPSEAQAVFEQAQLAAVAAAAAMPDLPDVGGPGRGDPVVTLSGTETEVNALRSLLDARRNEHPEQTLAAVLVALLEDSQ